MAPNTEERGDPHKHADRGVIQDRRVTPPGVLPRHMQMWLMVGIAVIILAIILFTGRQESPTRPQSSAKPSPPALVSPEHVRSYGQELATETARLSEAVAPQAGAARAGKPAGTGTSTTSDPMADDQRRRNYQSLFADSIALSRRAADHQPYGEPTEKARASSPMSALSAPELAVLQQLLRPSPTPASSLGAVPATAPTRATLPGSAMPSAPAAPMPLASSDAARGRGSENDVPTAPKQTGPIPAGGAVQRLLEGTVIEAVLLNRLDGTFAGPLDGLVTAPVYSHDRQSIVIPAGARVLGAVTPVQSWGDARLAVSFHRLVMPDGRTYSLDRFKGLDQIGDTGLKDSVNHHYVQVFGASLAIGALSGLAQYGTRSTATTSTFADDYRQAAGSSLAASTGRVLDRYLNVLPTITIHEGHRLKVYLTNDIDLPVYTAPALGGAR